MKRTFIIPFMLCVTFLYEGAVSCSCGNPKRAIRQAAYHYLDAMANYRVEDAVPFCTQETEEGVIRVGRNLVKAVEPGYIESDTPAKIKIKKVELTSDTAATVSYHKSTPLKKQNGTVNLVLRDGIWKVHILMGYQKPTQEPGDAIGMQPADMTQEKKVIYDAPRLGRN